MSKAAEIAKWEAAKKTAAAKDDLAGALEAKEKLETLKQLQDSDEKDKLIAERRAVDKKIEELEMAKISAAEKEEYDEASRLKDEIARLQEMANALPQAEPLPVGNTSVGTSGSVTARTAGSLVPFTGKNRKARVPKSKEGAEEKKEPFGSSIKDLRGQWFHSVPGIGAVIVKGERVLLPESGMTLRLSDVDGTIVLTTRNLAWALDRKSSNEQKVCWNNRSDGRPACFWARGTKRARYWDSKEGVSKVQKIVKPRQQQMLPLQDGLFKGTSVPQPLKVKHKQPPPPTAEEISKWEPFMNMALDEANRSIKENNHPFGAVLVLDGKAIMRAQSAVVLEKDPTCRAEQVLVRRACRELDTDMLARATIVSNTEPCPMCAGAIYWAGIGQIVYGCPTFELGKICGEELHLTCLDVVSTGKQHEVKVIGPILREQAVEMQRQYWLEDDEEEGGGVPEVPEDAAAEPEGDEGEEDRTAEGEEDGTADGTAEGEETLQGSQEESLDEAIEEELGI